MEKIYYDPPPETPPLMIVFSGREIIFYPPDQYWKRVEKEYLIGKVPVKKVSNINAPESERWRPYTGTHLVWEPDKEKNRLLASGVIPKPRNYTFVSKGAARECKKHKYKALAQYLKPERELIKQQEHEYTEIVKRAEKERAQFEMQLKRMEKERQRMIDDVHSELAGMKEALRKQAMEEVKAELLAEMKKEAKAQIAANVEELSTLPAEEPKKQVSAVLDLPPSITGKGKAK